MRHRQAVRQRTLTPSLPRFESQCRSIEKPIPKRMGFSILRYRAGKPCARTPQDFPFPPFLTRSCTEQSEDAERGLVRIQYRHRHPQRNGSFADACSANFISQSVDNLTLSHCRFNIFYVCFGFTVEFYKKSLYNMVIQSPKRKERNYYDRFDKKNDR